MLKYVRVGVLALSLCIVTVACSRQTPPVARQANAGIDSLNVRLSNAYRTHDAKAYAALFTDTAVFEWPAFNTVRGSAALEAMARNNWASLKDMDLELTVANRRIAPDHVTEIGAFEESFSDSSGKRMSEFGRYVAVLVPHSDGTWRMDRFFGFSDSTRPAPVRP